MRKQNILVVMSIAAVLTAAIPLVAQSQESLLGTWKMNAAKSKYSPGPTPRSNIAKDGQGQAVNNTMLYEKQ